MLGVCQQRLALEAGVFFCVFGKGAGVGGFFARLLHQFFGFGFGDRKHFKRLIFGVLNQRIGLFLGGGEHLLCLFAHGGTHLLDLVLRVGTQPVSLVLRVGTQPVSFVLCVGTQFFRLFVGLEQLGLRLRSRLHCRSFLLGGCFFQAFFHLCFSGKKKGFQRGGLFVVIGLRLIHERVCLFFRFVGDGVCLCLRFFHDAVDLVVNGFQFIFGFALGVHDNGISGGVGVFQQLIRSALSAFEDRRRFLIAISDQVVYGFFGFLRYCVAALSGRGHISVGKDFCRRDNAGVFRFGCRVDLFGLQNGVVDDAVCLGFDVIHLCLGVADDLICLLLCGGDDHIGALLCVIEHVSEHVFIFAVLFDFCSQNAQLSYHAAVFGKDIAVIGSDSLKRLVYFAGAVGIPLEAVKAYTFDLRRCKHNSLRPFTDRIRLTVSFYRLKQKTCRCFQVRRAGRPSRPRCTA